MISTLIQLMMTFGLLSLLAVGGGTAVLPEMQIILNQQFQVDHMKFVEVYSIGQLAPGPNMMMVSLLFLIMSMTRIGKKQKRINVPISFLMLYRLSLQTGLKLAQLKQH